MKTLPFWLRTVFFGALFFFAASVEAGKKPNETTDLRASVGGMTPARTETRRVYTNDDVASGMGSAEEFTLPAEAAQTSAPAEAAELEPPQVALTRIRHRAEEALERGLETLRFRERQLDVLDRDFILHVTQFYSDPNFAARERTGDRGGLDQLGRQIEQERSVIAVLENSLAPMADLVENLRWEAADEIAGEGAARRQTRDSWQGQLAPLRAELAALEAEMANFRDQIETGRTGIVLGRGNSFLSTYDYLNQLEQQKESVGRAIAAIEDEARQQNMLPGWLR